MNNKLKCASFFAGVGGIDIGFELTDSFETVYANEIDPYPARTYNLNSDITVDCRDIREVQPDQIPDFDVCLAGFPCQSFSVLKPFSPSVLNNASCDNTQHFSMFFLSDRPV